ncbi:hypothetical protein RB195_022473 [Necator americanus]|uniref:Uncharacterized protein n=1 Tax=Necator americanus TaxID=51031 RepID=A0ABR1EG34_NECAM
MGTLIFIALIVGSQTPKSDDVATGTNKPQWTDIEPLFVLDLTRRELKIGARACKEGEAKLATVKSQPSKPLRAVYVSTNTI